MNTRRDFLGFTAGAVAARTVLPLAARAQGDVHPDVAFIAFAARYPAALTALNAYTGPDESPEYDALLAASRCICWPSPATRLGVKIAKRR